jgi:hypothetical protein
MISLLEYFAKAISGRRKFYTQTKTKMKNVYYHCRAAFLGNEAGNGTERITSSVASDSP